MKHISLCVLLSLLLIFNAVCGDVNTNDDIEKRDILQNNTTSPEPSPVPSSNQTPETVPSSNVPVPAPSSNVPVPVPVPSSNVPVPVPVPAPSSNVTVPSSNVPVPSSNQTVPESVPSSNQTVPEPVPFSNQTVPEPIPVPFSNQTVPEPEPFPHGNCSFNFPCNLSVPLTKCMAVNPDPTETMPVNLTIAFYGDQGLDSSPYTGIRVELMKMLKNEENVSAIVHAGDFDYVNNPNAWDAMVTAAVGDDFPYFVAIGNHDLPAWGGYASNGAYNKLILARYERFGAKCLGDVGRDTICSFKGFTFVTSGIGTSTTYYEPFIESAFSNYGGIWRACVWHKNQEILNLGDKVDEVGTTAYNTCAKKGAMIWTGHEHSYCRSKPISYYGETDVTYLNITDDLITGPNLSWLTVTGTAGKDVRTCNPIKENYDWWAGKLCAPSWTGAGALICKFNLNGEMREAYCYFKDVNRKIQDSFNIYSENEIEYNCLQTPNNSIVWSAPVPQENPQPESNPFQPAPVPYTIPVPVPDGSVPETSADMRAWFWPVIGSIIALFCIGVAVILVAFCSQHSRTESY